MRRCVFLAVFLSLALCPWLHAPAVAGERPSLFRGVVIADSPVGVRVVSVDASSQAAQADLRPEDIIVRINGQDVGSVDTFATLSTTLKGHAVSASVVIFRNGQPHGILLHLYSYPMLDAWGIEFVPNDEIRFGQPQVGLDYWSRLGRGFEQAGKPEEALSAYLNGLHNVPADVATAFTVSQLSWQVGRARLASGQWVEGVAALQQAVAVLRRLFDGPLTDEQLVAVKAQLEQTLPTLREATQHLEQPSAAGR